MSQLNLKKVSEAICEFSKERDWDQFHSPKNLAISLSIEANELLEQFQWVSIEESIEFKNNSEKKAKISEEMADVLYYLIRISDKLDIDLESSFWKKMEANRKKYPIEKAKGNSKKYTEF